MKLINRTPSANQTLHLTARGAGFLPVAPCGISGACCKLHHTLMASELDRYLKIAHYGYLYFIKAGL